MPPPGWYPDPAGDSTIRYWDGHAWTDRVQSKSLPPPPPPPALPPTLVGPAAQSPVTTYGSARTPGAGAPGPLRGGYGSSDTGPKLVDPYRGYTPAPPPAALAAFKPGPDGQPLSGWWRRAGGYLIDSVIVGIPAASAAAIAASVITANGGALIDQAQWQALLDSAMAGGSPSPQEAMALFAPGFWTVLIVSGVVWFIASMINGVYLVSRSGQTLGDRVVKVRKVMAGRVVPTLSVALARWLIPNVLFSLVGNFVPLGFLLTYGDYLWALGDRRSQTLHDKMVRTYVERSDLAGPPVPRG